jgi:uncharacterized protein YjiS (DUF1127 family)
VHNLLPSYQNWEVYAFIVLPSVLLLGFGVSIIINRIRYSLQVRRNLGDSIGHLISSDEHPMNEGELKDLIRNLKKVIPKAKRYRSTKSEVFALKRKLTKVKEQLADLYLSRRNEIVWRKELLAREEQNRLKAEQERQLRILKERKENKLKYLNVDNTPVFIKSDLTKSERKLLLENGYSHCNEFCVEKQKYLSVLIKPTMHHSKTHTFLVWSVKNLLRKTKGVSNILDYDTREADINFRYNHLLFALEIETGTLLSKKHQLRAKVDYLNEKYSDRWMFVVSNKNLLPKYREFGVASSRSELPKKLKKLLKTATR